MPVLLLDFDGVLLRKHPIYETVSLRCRNYAQRHVGIRNPIKMKELNQEMYESYGHTVLGLKAMGYPVDTSDFNSHVYSAVDLKSLYNVKETHKHDIRAIKQMLATVQDNLELEGNVQVRIFSNAPDIWCQTILGMMGLDPIEKVDTMNHLKPEQKSYEMIEKMFPLERHFVFVDDKMINLKGVMRRPTWHKVLYAGQDVTDYTHHELPRVSVLNNLAHLNKTKAWKCATASLGIEETTAAVEANTKSGKKKPKSKQQVAKSPIITPDPAGVTVTSTI